MPRGFLLSTLSYNLSYESVYAQLGPRRTAPLQSHENDKYTQSEGILPILQGKISYHSLGNTFS